jgi:BMFP domain-containing protein YqiC
MDKQNILHDVQKKISEMLQQTPAKDIEKNIKAILNQSFAKLNLVTREELDIQMQVLTKARLKLEALEARVAELEQKNKL